MILLMLWAHRPHSGLSEVVVDLAHSRPMSGLRNGGPKLMVAEHVARADDHGLVL